MTSYLIWGKAFNRSKLQFPDVLLTVLQRNAINKIYMYLYIYIYIFRERLIYFILLLKILFIYF